MNCFILSKYEEILIPILQELNIQNVKTDEYDLRIIDVNYIPDAMENYHIQQRKNIPTIILSTSNVYSCLNNDNKVQEIPFTEDSPLVVPSTSSCYSQLRDLSFEAGTRNCFPNHIVLRLCNVYGRIGTGVVNSLIYAMLEDFRIRNDFIVFHSLYRKKSFLYIEDFKVILSKVISLTLEGLRGVYNIGSNDIITVHNLAETVYQVLRQTNHKPKLTLVDDPHRFHNFYEAVDISRIQALTNWKPEYSIRKGVWTYIQEELWRKQI